MKHLFLALFLLPTAYATQDFDAAVDHLTLTIVEGIAQTGTKKVAVIDFLDLQGHSNELGRYLAEQLSVGLVSSRKGFTVMDRANMKHLLEEHKLTAKGLVDPEKAKQLGRFSGVDAIILGTITQFGDSIAITAKVISTESTEVLAASKASIQRTKDLAAMLSPEIPATQPNTIQEQPTAVNPTPASKPTTFGSNSFPTILAELVSFRVSGSGEMIASMRLTSRVSTPLRVGFNVNRESRRKGVGLVVSESTGATARLSEVIGLSFSDGVYGGNPDSYQGIKKQSSDAEKWGQRKPNFINSLFEELDKFTDLPVGQSIQFTMRFQPEPRVSYEIPFRLNAEIIVIEMLSSTRVRISLNSVSIPGIKP